MSIGGRKKQEDCRKKRVGSYIHRGIDHDVGIINIFLSVGLASVRKQFSSTIFLEP